ncbi:MAG: hypothetical protein DWB99_02685 [Candidatus Poseidoniales archaeon]|nr:MAG: hypothetical protein DWB99_02685 [Candidatus Poseidoniales archaeon]|tara:strand:- start:1083 stop:2150 length:1068 start_codon:yes stop_codon:yes gene_type:complete
MDTAWWRRPSTLPLIILSMALLIIVAGGSIRINDAGESCPDWPKCFGTYGFDVSPEEQEQYWDENPDEIDSRGEFHRYTVFEIFLEWIHRLLVGIIAIPIIANFFIARKNIETYGKSNYYSSIFIGTMLIIQAGAGAITVFFDNADWTVALHLSLACIFSASIIWQYLLMRVKEGADWKFLSTSKQFIEANMNRFDAIAASILFLLILGAWVSSTAGGQYNQSCSVGFPNGWPKCNGSFLPSLDGPGVLIQMIHRIGALVIGIILIASVIKVQKENKESPESEIFLRYMHNTGKLWLLNLLIGASYLIFAKSGDFPEWLSLLHLVGGISCFLVSLVCPFMIRLSLLSKNINSEAE